MDLEEKVFKEILEQSGYTNKIKQMLTDLYMKAYHDGRHAERDRLVNSGYLYINPNKKKQLELDCKNPCEGCIERADYLKIGCKSNPKECKLKQTQLRALEILTNFNNGNQE